MVFSMMHTKRSSLLMITDPRQRILGMAWSIWHWKSIHLQDILSRRVGELYWGGKKWPFRKVQDLSIEDNALEALRWPILRLRGWTSEIFQYLPYQSGMLISIFFQSTLWLIEGKKRLSWIEESTDNPLIWNEVVLSWHCERWPRQNQSWAIGPLFIEGTDLNVFKCPTDHVTSLATWRASKIMILGKKSPNCPSQYTILIRWYQH